ncbi:ABC transporter ATP-binding protein [Brucella sp. 21LCYQ03]|nr:ABC transporter ATP-binding protein [Brucella sp. 21LCYQ03]
MTYAIELQGITKRFGALTANERINLAVKKGEIHALVGENGAGKSTLMNILFGIYQPDEGLIRIHGQDTVMHSPKTAIDCGLGMVHQHFKLVPSLTVAENIFLGMEITKKGLINHKAQIKRVSEISETFGLKVDPTKLVNELSVGTEQRVEILKALARGAEIVILDEPTAVLTPQESRELFKILRNFANQGMTVVFISHHLSEVMAHSDTITVLRDGKAVGSKPTKDMTEDELVRMMVGREVNFSRRPRNLSHGQEVLRLSRIYARDGRGMPVLEDVSFSVNAGEIVGIVGVDGNGQTELAEVIAGLRKPSHGNITLQEKDISGDTPRAVRETGLAHVPGDRLSYGVNADDTITANLLMGRQHRTPWASKGLVNWGYATEQAVEMIRKFDIRARGPKTIVRTLSGGNMQKVVLAREFSQNCPFLIVDQPTRGVDIGAMEGIHDEIMNQREQGAAILLISVQLDEILKLADRVLVMFSGTIAGEVDPETATEDEIGYLMAGSKASDAKGIFQ